MKTTLRKFSRIFIGTILFFFVGLNKSEAQGASLAFNGSNDYVQVSSLNFGNNWTAEAWIYPTNVGGVNWKTALGQSYWNGPSGFVIAIASNSVFLEGPQGFHIGYPVTANVWSHVAATYNNGIFAFYVNGVLAGVQTGTFTNSTAPFFIGSRNDNNVTNNSSMMDAFTGRIDEIRIWNTTRSQCDIQSHMNSEIPTTQSGLVANYHFNQCSGTYIIDVLAGATCSSLDDATGNGNTGTFSSVLLSIGLSPVWNTGGSPAQGVTTPASANTSEIDITGNGNSIADGSAVPSTTNHTNFNGAFTRTFVISNSGSQVLSVGVPVLTGTAASQFSVTTVPASTLAATSGSTSFVVTFNPNSTGVKNATLNVYSLDCSEPFYSFAITATAVAGGALDFYGNSGTGEDYVTAADPIIGTSDCTIETWFKQTSTSGGYLVSNRSYEGGPGGYWWAVNISGGVNQGQVGIELGDAGGIGYTGISSAPGLFALNTWNHVAVVRSGTIITVYLNGVSVATATDSGVR
ncbi:MAG: choice-of-anchor D domain-containing protein, partial [Bacteroidia bacterium]|nr:choice-of-anchor D domain-containing protein [Bacteroidia bacterium]